MHASELVDIVSLEGFETNSFLSHFLYCLSVFLGILYVQIGRGEKKASNHMAQLPLAHKINSPDFKFLCVSDWPLAKYTL